MPQGWQRDNFQCSEEKHRRKPSENVFCFYVMAHYGLFVLIAWEIHLRKRYICDCSLAKPRQEGCGCVLEESVHFSAVILYLTGANGVLVPTQMKYIWSSCIWVPCPLSSKLLSAYLRQQTISVFQREKHAFLCTYIFFFCKWIVSHIGKTYIQGDTRITY
jgi:hypothetical protein